MTMKYIRNAVTSIIICALNHLQDLSVPCISNLLANTDGPFELILIDDGSHDETFSYFRNLTRKAYRNRSSKGVAVSRNRGIKASEGEYVVFLDNDVTVPPGWLLFLKREATKPNVGIIGPILSNEMQNLNLPRSADGLIDVAAISGACTFIKREVLDAVGLLDERFTNIAEDTDFCIRARKAGYRVVITPRLMVNHISFATRRDVPRAPMQRSRALFDKMYNY